MKGVNQGAASGPYDIALIQAQVCFSTYEYILLSASAWGLLFLASILIALFILTSNAVD